MEEDINELRRICQQSRRKYDTWHGIYICRSISIYITRALLPLGVSADFVTVVFLLIGLLSCVFFTLGTNTGFFIGIVVLQFWYIMDHVDGEVARYRRKETVTGIYFDKIVHYLVHPSVFFCIGIGLYRNTGNFSAVLAGFLTGISILLISVSEDLKDATIVQKAAMTRKSLLFNKGEESIDTDGGTVARKIPAAVFSFVHKLCSFPGDMNVLTIAIVLNIFAFKNSLLWALYAYMVVSTFVWIAKLAVIVKEKRIDSEMGELTE